MVPSFQGLLVSIRAIILKKESTLISHVDWAKMLSVTTSHSTQKYTWFNPENFPFILYAESNYVYNVNTIRIVYLILNSEKFIIFLSMHFLMTNILS